ncbi:MAG: dihydrolipoamide acetyltransferase family protein, partial [Nakamurella sp.]
MPDVGEGLTEAEILGWRVEVGDLLTVNQVMVEIETAKAAVELPSPFAGRVHLLLVQPGVMVAVGTPIITVDTDPGGAELAAETSAEQDAPAQQQVDESSAAGAKIGETTADGRIATLVGYVSATGATVRRARRSAPRIPVEPPAVVSPPEAVSPPAAGPAGLGPVTAVSAAVGAAADHHPPLGAAEVGPAVDHQAPLATPPVRKLAKDLGVDLGRVRSSAADGVISRRDVQAAASAASLATAYPAPAYAATAYPDPAYPGAGGPDAWTRERRIPVRGIRRATAAAMVASAFSAPHVTEFLTIDVTPMMALRDRLRRRPEFADIKLTPLAFAARAVCLAARRTPELNAVYEVAAEDSGDDEIVLKDYVNLGIAAATPRGLVVPVIPGADALDLAGLANAIQQLTATARAGHTSVAEMKGGTFTITNVGVFGIDTGTPIINPGEAGILALGSIKDAPWVVDGQLAVRKVCQL